MSKIRFMLKFMHALWSNGFQAICMFFLKLIHLWPIYVLLLAYTPNSSIIEFSSGFQVSFDLIWSDMSAPLPGISDQTYLETTKSVFTRHVRPLAWTYPALGLKGIKRPLIPLRTLTSQNLLHFISCGFKVLPRRFGGSSTESLWFLVDLPPLPLVFFKP
jgi:hypothetical protein